MNKRDWLWLEQLEADHGPEAFSDHDFEHRYWMYSPAHVAAARAEVHRRRLVAPFVAFAEQLLEALSGIFGSRSVEQLDASPAAATRLPEASLPDPATDAIAVAAAALSTGGHVHHGHLITDDEAERRAEALRIRAYVDETNPRRNADGSINAAHVALEQTLRDRSGLHGWIAELDGPGRYSPASELLDGATVTPAPDRALSNAGEFAASWNGLTPEQRDDWVLIWGEQSERSRRCIEANHDRATSEIARLHYELEAALRRENAATDDAMNYRARVTHLEDVNRGLLEQLRDRPPSPAAEGLRERIERAQRATVRPFPSARDSGAFDGE